MRNEPHGVSPLVENADATKKRNDDTSRTCAGPRHSRAIDGNGLALLRGYPGHHRQAQRDRLEHRAAPAGEPAAALGLQSHASLAGKIVERFRPPELYPSRPGALWHLCLESPDSRSGLSFLRLPHAHLNAIGAQEWIFRKPAAAHARDGVAPDLPFGRAGDLHRAISLMSTTLSPLNSPRSPRCLMVRSLYQPKARPAVSIAFLNTPSQILYI